MTAPLRPRACARRLSEAVRTALPNPSAAVALKRVLRRHVHSHVSVASWGVSCLSICELADGERVLCNLPDVRQSAAGQSGESLDWRIADGCRARHRLNNVRTIDLLAGLIQDYCATGPWIVLPFDASCIKQ
jgi:hypothetical protein